MCPALIFAANRNESVIGRTVTLVVSIRTRNGFSHSGAPSGRKWAIDILRDLKNLDIIRANHRGKPKISVKIKCLDVLKKYGISPSKLIVMIEKNRVVTVWFNPLRLFMNERVNWVLMIMINGVIAEFDWDGVIQKVNCVIIMSVIFIIINNLIDGLIELNLYGSKEEKMSGIIKTLSIKKFEGFSYKLNVLV